MIFGDIPGWKSFDKIIAEQDPAEVQQFKCTQLLTADHPAAIFYTSGTTGLPKGALHSHKSLSCNVELAAEMHYHNKTYAALWYSTFCWITGALSSLGCIWSPMKRVITGPFNEEETCRNIEKFKVVLLLID